MPVLKNPRHERFAQLLASGKTAKDAYALAGYRPSESNGAWLSRAGGRFDLGRTKAVLAEAKIARRGAWRL
jgi:hypothetical protein